MPASTDATTTEEDLLAGITAKTTRPELIERLTKAQERLRAHEKKTTDRLAEIEARVREKNRPNHSRAQMFSVMVTGTDVEFRELIEFLEEFEELLPVAGIRVLTGYKAITEGKVSTT